MSDIGIREKLREISVQYPIRPDDVQECFLCFPNVEAVRILCQLGVIGIPGRVIVRIAEQLGRGMSTRGLVVAE